MEEEKTENKGMEAEKKKRKETEVKKSGANRSEEGKKKEKPQYGMWQNSAYMIALAWKEKEKKVLACCLLLAAFSVAGNLVNLYVSPSVLAAVEERVPLAELLCVIGGFVGAMMLCSAVSSYVGTNALYGRVQVRCALIAALNRKSSTTSYPNVGDEKFIKLCTKASDATCANSQATEAVWGTLTGLATNVLGFVIYLFLLANLDLWMLLVIAVTTLTGYFVRKRLNEYEYRHREEVAEYENKMWYIDGRAKDYEAAKDIRIFGMKPWLEELGEKALEAYTAFYKKANGVYIWGNILDLVLTFARNGIAYSYLIHMVLNQGMSASEFLLYFTAIGGFASWVTGILGDLSTLHKQSLDLSIVRECLEYPEPFLLEDGKPLSVSPGVQYEIRLEDVTFRYPESDKDILKNVNLTLHPGEKLAVVGLNGAGKTTLVKLMCGFLDPVRGRVLLDGKDIREYNRRDYYKMFSAVFQSFSLLAGTVKTNVAQSLDEVDMDRVRECARQADLLDKIESLPSGFDTYLNRNVYEDAVMLSGGETQRLMLARALYKDAPVIVLDEPTAALDPIAEAELYQKYNEMTSGKSSVYISHRLASTRFCDRIILIEGNCITEEGTHEELLARGGRYAELYEVQSKYYRSGGDEYDEE